MKREERKSPEFWAALKAEYRAGGLTQKELARKHQVSVHTLKEHVRPNGGRANKSPVATPPFLSIDLGETITEPREAMASKPQVMALIGASPEYLAAFIKLLNGPC